jgi:HEAT repeat protein
VRSNTRSKQPPVAERGDLAALERARLRGDVDYILKALRDVTTRRLAARYAAQLDARQAIPQLLAMLRAHDPPARSAAASALGKLGAREALDDLADIALEDEDPIVRAWAAGAIGEIGGEEAVGVLAAVLDSEDWVVRRAAVYGLGASGERSALALVEQARMRERWTRRRVYREAARRLRHAIVDLNH